MNKEQLLEATKANVETLKQVLTDEQKAKLDYSELRPFTADMCLFGQLFGDANSDEAKALLPKTLKGSYQVRGFYEHFARLQPSFRISFDRFNEFEVADDGHSTPIELFLMTRTNSEDLFKYLKGEVEAYEPAFID